MSKQYFVVRADRAGVFAGNIKERSGSEVTMTNVRQLWYWDGANDVHDIAMNGVKRPRDCKFTVTVPDMVILGVIEVIPCTEHAEEVIKGVPEWRA